MNGDGYDDAVVVQPARPASERVQVFHGAPGGSFDTTPDGFATTNYTGGCTITRLNANADAYDDIAVSSGGQIRVYHGSASGLDATVQATLDREGPLTALDVTNDGYD